MLGQFVHCEAAHLSDRDTYRLYLQATRDVCSFLLSEKAGVYGGNLGRVGGGVPGIELSAEARNIESVREFVARGGGRLEWRTRADGASRSDGPSAGVRCDGVSASKCAAGSALVVGAGSSDRRGEREIRGVSCESGGADCADPVRGRHSEGVNVALGVGLRGPNWERNNRWREKKRRAKGRREASGSGPGVDVVPGIPLTSQEESPSETQGFWRSCSDDVRQQLIDSKARMHIAENERRARKARLDVERMNAPVAILEEAMRHVRLAQRCAKEKGDSKVAGWAETVANSYAESVARSAPSTIPSYASVASTATSVSVDGSARVKPGSVKWFERRISALRTLKEMYVVYGELERATNLTAPQKQMVDLMLDDCRDRLASNK